MNISHIALQYPEENIAGIFFGKVLGLKLAREFILLSDFSRLVFNVKRDIKVKVYSDEKTTFEIFIAPNGDRNIFDHFCLEVESKDKLMENCEKYGIEMISTEKNGKKYLFIRDFSGYLYEIKEI